MYGWKVKQGDKAANIYYVGDAVTTQEPFV